MIFTAHTELLTVVNFNNQRKNTNNMQKNWKIFQIMRPLYRTLSLWKRACHQQAKNPSSVWIKPSGYDTGIIIYNQLEKQKVPLILKNNKVATWYMCGPTVYDSAHIGHACAYIRLDIIRRILTGFFNVDIISVMSITDIDDKIIRRSQGSSQFSDWSQLAKNFEQEFYAQMRALNVLPPNLYCRVSDYIPQIIQFIRKIMDKNMAYVAKDGSVYFNTLEYGKYGKFNMSKFESHAVKKCNLDFALWKASKDGEPAWESPWGPGRPGWHIECSTMGSFTLGNSIDIHSGGQDLMFPHHENEEAQSCSHHGTDQWVNYWIHSGLLHLDDVKMSKSLQNTISIKNFLEKYTANQLRLFCLLNHYRYPIAFSYDIMNKAVTVLKQFEYFQSDCQNYMAGKLGHKVIDESLIYASLDEAQKKIHIALADDFSTHTVILELINLMTLVNKMIQPTQKSANEFESRNAACINAVSTYITRTLSILGITNALEADCNSEKLSEVVDTFVNFRNIVRNKALKQDVKDKELLNACDDARKRLAVCRIKVKDYKDTSTWTIVDE